MQYSEMLCSEMYGMKSVAGAFICEQNGPPELPLSYLLSFLYKVVFQCSWVHELPAVVDDLQSGATTGVFQMRKICRI
jgi:hypothetical protein